MLRRRRLQMHSTAELAEKIRKLSLLRKSKAQKKSAVIADERDALKVAAIAEPPTLSNAAGPRAQPMRRPSTPRCSGGSGFHELLPPATATAHSGRPFTRITEPKLPHQCIVLKVRAHPIETQCTRLMYNAPAESHATGVRACRIQAWLRQTRVPDISARP